MTDTGEERMRLHEIRVSPPWWYRTPPPPRSRLVRARDMACAVALPFAAAGALVPVRDRLPNTSVALALALVVVVLAAFGGRVPAVVAALSASAGFDLFHTRPYGSLAIRQPADLQTTGLLLIVALVVGQLAVRNRGYRQQAITAVEELDLIHEAAEMVAAGDPADQVVAVVADSLTRLLALRACRFETSFSEHPGPFVERDGALTWGAVRWPYRVWGLPDRGVTLTVEHGGLPLGRFVLVPSHPAAITAARLRVAVALADQAGAALAAAGGQVGLTS